MSEQIICPRCKSENIIRKDKHYMLCKICDNIWSPPRKPMFPRIGKHDIKNL